MNLDIVRSNLVDRGVEVRIDFPTLDPILYIGFNPIFDVVSNARSPMNKGHSRARPKQLQGRNRSGVFSPYHYNIMVIVRVRLLIVMNDFRKLFSRYV